MESTSTEERGALGADHVATPLPAFVDWIIGAVLAVGGLAGVLGGATMLLAVDRPAIERGVAEGAIQSDVLSGPDLVEVSLAVATWTAVGLLVTGVVMVLAGVAYLVARRRTHRRAEAGEPTSDYVAIALLGALVSGVLSFLPFSPAIGGAAAGYLERGESERVVSVGALSGLLTMAPVLALATFSMAGLAVGLSEIGEGTWAILAGIALLLVLAMVAVVGGGLGAIGGFVGGKLAEGEA